MDNHTQDEYTGFCACPPHPELIARLQSEENRRQQHLFAAGGGDGVPPPGEAVLRPPLPAPTPEEKENRKLISERAVLRGPIKVVIVLVDFSDKVMGANAASHFNDLFFSHGKIATGSVTEYYSEVTKNLISITGQVVGPYRMPKKMSEYAHGKFGRGSVAPNARNLAADALAAAKPHVNFKPYDNDGNGFVDAFIVVHAGSGAEQTGNVNDLWSLKWYLPTATPVNGVKVFGFLTIPEDAYIGVCCHELGHLLFEWPDLYDIDSPGDPNDIGIVSAGIGNWCLMAGGSWGRIGNNKPGSTPCHPSAWCKKNQSWVNVINETTNHSLSLPDVKSNHQIHRLWTNGNTASKEYFLLENRQQTGFDRSLPAPGLLIWHIDDAKTNNRDEKHYWVGLMQADGLNQLAKASAGRGDGGDPYPGTTNNHAFDKNTNPNSRAYSGQDSLVSVTNISASSANMTMNVKVRL